MVTGKELLDAQSFTRRRLVTALVSAAADPNPGRPGPTRTVVIGLVLAGLLTGGAAVAGRLAPEFVTGPDAGASAPQEQGP